MIKVIKIIVLEGKSVLFLTNLYLMMTKKTLNLLKKLTKNSKIMKN